MALGNPKCILLHAHIKIPLLNRILLLANLNQNPNFPSTSMLLLISSVVPPCSSCQICGKLNHRALDCFHRMDYSFQEPHTPSQLAAMVAQTNAMPEDHPWYANSGANNHVTNDVANLSLYEPYNGEDSVAIGNGSRLPIQNTGSLTLQTPSYSLNLKHVLHCPTAMANLLSINQFCLDNDYFFILTGTHYFIKDNKTGTTLLEGLSEGDFIPFTSINIWSINFVPALLSLVSRHLWMFGMQDYAILPLK